MVGADEATMLEEVEKIRAEIAELKRRKDILDAVPSKKGVAKNGRESEGDKVATDFEPKTKSGTIKTKAKGRNTKLPAKKKIKSDSTKGDVPAPHDVRRKVVTSGKTDAQSGHTRLKKPVQKPKVGKGTTDSQHVDAGDEVVKPKSDKTTVARAKTKKPKAVARKKPVITTPKPKSDKVSVAKSKPEQAEKVETSTTPTTPKLDPLTKKAVTKKTKRTATVPELTLEEKLESELTEDEIERFQIEKVNMEQLIRKVCDILAEREHDGMLQNELWKKLKLSDMIGSRLALKLERMGTITREKILENDRWTYKLILKRTPISTQSIEDAPCLVCPVEQQCTLDGEISPRTCKYIEDWVVTVIKKPRSK